MVHLRSTLPLGLAEAHRGETGGNFVAMSLLDFVFVSEVEDFSPFTVGFKSVRILDITILYNMNTKPTFCRKSYVLP